MPVILRLCVAIERTAPLPSLDSPASPSSPTPAQAATAPPEATTTTTTTATTPAKSTAGVPSVPDAAKAKKRRSSLLHRSNACTTADTTTGKSEKGNADTSTASSSHRHSRLNPLRWFRSLGKDKKKKPPSPFQPPAHTDAPAASPATHSNSAEHDPAQSSGKADAALTHHPSLPSLSPPDSAVTAAAVSASVPPARGEGSTNDTTAMKTEQRDARGGVGQRSLVWLSVQLTPTSTARAVVQQVRDMVERRIGAKLCEQQEGEGHSVFSGFTTPAGSFAQSQEHRGAVSGTAASHDDGRHNASPTTTTTTNTNTNNAPEAAEWCLCLQDGEGVYHWVGGTRHHAKSAVLRAPFVTEVCLQSHAAFEAQREGEGDGRAGASGSSPHASFATAALDHLRGDASSDTIATSVSPTTSAALSSDSGSEGRGADGSGRPGRGGRRRSPPQHHHRQRHASAPSSHPPKTTKKKNRKGGGGDAAAAATARRGRLYTTVMAAKKFSAPSAGDVKFAFLKGVVVPLAVLQLRNPALTRHHRRPPLYMEVHVPRAMRAEPLDASATPTGDQGVPPLHPHDAVTAGASAPAPESTSSVVRDVAEHHDGKPHTNRDVGSPFSKEEDVDVDGLVNGRGASNPPHSKSSSFASSASTMPSASPPRQPAEEPDGNKPELVATRQQPTAATVWTGGDVHGAGGAGAVAVLPTGLATHATTLETAHINGVAAAAGEEEEDVWCRSEEAAHVKGVGAALLEQLTAVEDAARSALAAAQQAYVSALVAHQAAVPPTPEGLRGARTAVAPVDTDAELTALLKRKIELQATVEEGRQAERECERLTMLVECLERELQEHEERRQWIAARTG